MAELNKDVTMLIVSGDNISSTLASSMQLCAHGSSVTLGQRGDRRSPLEVHVSTQIKSPPNDYTELVGVKVQTQLYILKARGLHGD